MARALHSGQPTQIVLRSASLVDRLRIAISTALNISNFDKTFLQALEKVAKRWEKEPDPSAYISNIAKILFNAKNLFEASIKFISKVLRTSMFAGLAHKVIRSGILSNLFN